MPSTYIDFHILQTVPPSNLNRDDTGTPKSAIYGGVTRARVSSQAWKRATRRDFADHLDESQLALRTKRVVDQIAHRLVSVHGLEADAARERAAGVVTGLGFKLEKGRATKKGEQAPEDNLTEYLTFFSNGQLDRFAEVAASGDAVDKKALAAAAQKEHGVEVALFGRMVADAQELSVDAACQVAHAISTHASNVEHDYYTAVDDKAPEDNAGAGMLGTIEYTSATLYRYATISFAQLVRNLGTREAAIAAVRAFADAFVRSMPTGKQNTFANRTPVDAVVVQVRRGQPINLVGAFEDAVVSEAGYVEPSARALVDYAKAVQSSYAGDALASFVVRVSPKAAAVDELGDALTLDDLGRAVVEAIPVGDD